jgi:hypothetical protein
MRMRATTAAVSGTAATMATVLATEVSPIERMNIVMLRVLRREDEISGNLSRLITVRRELPVRIGNTMEIATTAKTPAQNATSQLPSSLSRIHRESRLMSRIPPSARITPDWRRDVSTTAGV